MRLAVIDNSTLTAVQRLLGEIEVENTSSLDGDIAAFETLIQAILFYDTVLYIDDYKQDFRSSRRATFHYLGSIDTASIPYQKLIGAATALVDDVILKVKAGKINPNEIGAFLNSLKMYTTFTWDMRGSEYFLTMKMLEGAGGLSAEKYSTLNEMIFLELRANRETVAIRRSGQYYSLVGSDGRSIPKDEVSLQVRAFASSLNWLAIRTAFYTLFSCNYKATRYCTLSGLRFSSRWRGGWVFPKMPLLRLKAVFG